MIFQNNCSLYCSSVLQAYSDVTKYPEENEGALCFVKMHTNTQRHTWQLLNRVWYRVGKFIQPTQAPVCACIPRHRWDFSNTECVCMPDKTACSKLLVSFSIS